MAQKLEKYYRLIGQLQSMQGKMNLAMKTRCPSTKAPLEPDSPALIEAFEKAFKEITGLSAAEAEKKINEMESKK